MTTMRKLPEALDVDCVASLQSEWTERWHRVEQAPTGEGFVGAVMLNHHFNFMLWHEEDIARVDDDGAERVRLAKRRIDKFNQGRNDAMESVDDHLLTYLGANGMDTQSRMHTETPGMIIDRLSIIGLKHYHMAEEATRSTASNEHRDRCAERVQILARQRSDLERALSELIEDVLAGERHFRKYRQLKMYNDPQLNPQLYRTAR
jgi:hypothetical protein